MRQIAQSHQAELIAVSGDARAKTMLLEHLGPDWSARAVPLPSVGRAEGSGRAQARRAAIVAAARAEESLRADVRDRYAGRLTTGGAVEGLVPTAEALRRGTPDGQQGPNEHVRALPRTSTVQLGKQLIKHSRRIRSPPRFEHAAAIFRDKPVTGAKPQRNC